MDVIEMSARSEVKLCQFFFKLGMLDPFRINVTA
jgi:hypothetical protein